MTATASPSTDTRRRPRLSAPALVSCTRPAALRAVPELRRFAQRTARQWAVPEEAGESLALVVSELVSNAVLHSGSATVVVRLTRGLDTVTVEVVNHGQWRDRAPDPDGLHGRGLVLVKAVSSWWLAASSAAGTRVLVRIPLHGAHSKGGPL
jgi:anti-sigma regulatory factor (Ser/Thr protein kinase)